MKHLKRLLSMALVVAMLIPSTIMPDASAHEQELHTQHIHPFSSTEQLIKDAVVELREQGQTMEEATIDHQLIADVEEHSNMTFNEVKTTVMTRMKDALVSGAMDVSDLNLSKATFEKVMEDVLEENYLYNAISNMTYATSSGKVTKLGFTASEGYQTAMGAMEDEHAVLKAKVQSILAKIPSLYFEGNGFQLPERPMVYAMTLADEPACQRHTVGGGVLLGDMNGDKTVDVKDLNGIRSIIAKNEDAATRTFPAEADVNKDGAVTEADLSALRQMIVDEAQPEMIGGPDIQFKWALQQDFTPRDAEGNALDLQNHPEDQEKIANGGLVYMPNRETGEMEIQQGIMPDISWGLEEVSFTCAECGETVSIKRNAQDPTDPVNQMLDQMITRYNIYLDMTKVNPETGEGMQEAMQQVPVDAEQPKTTKTFILFTEVSVAQFADDSFNPEQTGPNGLPVGLYMDTNKDANGQDNNDNLAAENTFYYNMFSAFNADHADYLGVSGRYWTTKNSDADPMAAVKSLCNIPLDKPIPPAAMAQVIQMLPQAFMSYVMFYGPQLMDMKAAAGKLVESLPAKATRIHKMLVLHDWVAENTMFDMGAMMNVSESEGNPETDPIQMTAFGALLSHQLSAAPSQNGKIYGGCICLGYVAAYNLLLQEFVYADAYKNEDGSWKTPDEVGENDYCDFGQVMFYSNTSNTSIAGEGFGGGFFNNVHYYNMVRVPEAPQVDPNSNQHDKKNPRIGDWFFVDVCYDDIFVECMSQYRAEADGSVHHDYFLASPLTMNKIWGNAVDYISNLHDGVEFKTKVDENGKPVPYPKDDEQHYNPKDPDHPMHVTVPSKTEKGSDNTCYQDTWFSGAVSKIYNDGKNWYYVDSENSTLGFADKAEKDDDGNYKFNFEDMAKHDVKTGIHATRASQAKQAKMKSRPMSAVDYWEGEKEEGGLGGIMGGQKPKEYKKDPHAKVLMDYGTGKGYAMADSPELMEAVKEHYTYTDQYPGLTLCLGYYEHHLYFNLGNRIYEYDLKNNTCKAVKTYTDVSAMSDGRTFIASSFVMDDAGKDLHVQDNPIAGLVVRTAYIPQSQTVTGPDGNPMQVYAGMKEENVMTVNIGTNYSFTAAFDANADMDANMETVYTKQAYNYNGDYNQVLENNLAEAKKSKNNNKEFLWCANIRDEFPMGQLVEDIEADAIAVDDHMIPCTAAETGHNYVYNPDEEMFICENCLLHAKNIVEENEFFNITMHHNPSSGEGGGGGIGDIIGGGSNKEEKTIVPVNDSREAAVLEGGKMKDGKLEGGKILVEVTPKDASIDKEVTAIQYRDTKGSAPVVVTEKDENGMFIINKPEKTDTSNGCMIVSVVTDNAFRVTTTFEGGDGSAEITPTPAVPGKPVTVKITTNPDRGVKAVSVMAGETPVENVDWDKETNEVTFEMPEASVNVNITLEQVYKISIEGKSASIIKADKTKAPAGAEIHLSPVTAGQSFKSVSVTDAEGNQVDVNNMTFTMPASAVTVTAEAGDIVLETYNLSVVGGHIDGITENPAKIAPEGTATIVADPGEKQVFDHWTATNLKLTEEQAKKNPLTITMPAKDVTVTANFKNLYTVSFNAGEGVENPASVLTNKDGKLEKLPTVSKEGFRFDGWFTAAEGGEKVDLNKVYTENTTLYAHWSQKTYAVNVTGGTCGEVKAYKQGETVTITANEPAEGKEFAGWTVEPTTVVLKDASAATTTFVMPAAPVKVTATFRDASKPDPQPTATSLTLTADKVSPKAGETVTFTVKLGAVENMRTLKFKLAMPEGLTYTSSQVPKDLATAMKAGELDFTADTLVFTYLSNKPETAYTNTADTVLMTLTCTVNEGATGALTLGFVENKLECYYNDEKMTSIPCTMTPATITVAAADPAPEA